MKGLYKKIVSVAMKQLKSGQETEVTKEMLTVLFLIPAPLSPIRSVKPIRSASELLQRSGSPAKPQRKLFVGDQRSFTSTDIFIGSRKELLLTG